MNVFLSLCQIFVTFSIIISKWFIIVGEGEGGEEGEDSDDDDRTIREVTLEDIRR